jgi:hypothetical protein
LFSSIIRNFRVQVLKYGTTLPRRQAFACTDRSCPWDGVRITGSCSGTSLSAGLGGRLLVREIRPTRLDARGSR